MVEYKSRIGSHISEKQAELFGQRLEKIRVDYTLTPEMVVEDAHKKSSPLHDYFEWDDNEAANKWRLQQARVLIASIEIVREDKPIETTRAYHFVQERYVAAEIVFNDADMRIHVIEIALKELEGWQKRYTQYQELAQLRFAITNDIIAFRGEAK